MSRVNLLSGEAVRVLISHISLSLSLPLSFLQPSSYTGRSKRPITGATQPVPSIHHLWYTLLLRGLASYHFPRFHIPGYCCYVTCSFRINHAVYPCIVGITARGPVYLLSTHHNKRPARKVSYGAMPSLHEPRTWQGGHMSSVLWVPALIWLRMLPSALVLRLSVRYPQWTISERGQPVNCNSYFAWREEM
jgi:hypothetical protein